MKKIIALIKKFKFRLIAATLTFAAVAGLAFGAWRYGLAVESEFSAKLTAAQKELADLKNQDQIKINQSLNTEVSDINKTYKRSISIYESLLDLKLQNPKVSPDLDKEYALAINYLADKNYSSASASLSELDNLIKTENTKLAQIVTKSTPAAPATPTVDATIGQSGQVPAGFSTQAVKISSGTYTVYVISADLSSTKVIVDTASSGDCRDSCPVMSLGDYVGRNGAFAGINGNFFCPAEYPSCVGKTNSFDTLVMNKNKTYFNSDNNVYSNIPAAIFSAGSARFVSRSLEWGRDTGVDSVIANYPLYLSGGQVIYGGNSNDSKIDSKGSRSFVGAKGSSVYIGYVLGASSKDAAEVLKALGLQEAMGLDQGGSTALWFGGYKLGPGRGIPNALLFIKR